MHADLFSPSHKLSLLHEFPTFPTRAIFSDVSLSSWQALGFSGPALEFMLMALRMTASFPFSVTLNQGGNLTRGLCTEVILESGSFLNAGCQIVRGCRCSLSYVFVCL